MTTSEAQNFNNKALSKNIIFSVITFLLNTFISFFITPYISERFGSDIYGYVKLANEFANYAALFSIALNSMSSRFIMLERVRGDQKKANQYFSSVAVANIIMAAVFVLPSGICVYYLDRIFEINPLMVFEVKLTFALTFLNFIVRLLVSIYSNCYYITNTLYIQSLRGSQASILNVALVLGLFLFFSPHISYVVLGTLAATLFIAADNICDTRKLTPDLRFRASDFNARCVGDILSSGIWNSITQLSQIFTSGLDLLITNLFISPVMMGYLSIAKTVPNVIFSFNSTVANVFSPNLMQLYARGDREGLKAAAKSAMRFMCLFVSIPSAILCTMGTDFYRLWVPGQPAEMISVMSVLTIVNSCISGPLQPIYQIFTITNKVRSNSIVMIIYGIASLFCTYILLQLTDWGVYAILGSSLTGALLVAFFYHIPYSAKYIGLPKTAFVPEILRSVLSFLAVSAIGFLINRAFDLSSWLAWFSAAIATAALGFAINFSVVLSKKEKLALYTRVKGKLRKNP